MGENFDFYVGSVENAPIYPTYDNSAGNTADSKGQSIIDNSQSGLDDVRFYNSALADILAEGGSLTAGLFFLNGFLTDIIGNVAWLNSVLVISLALGVLMLILGITNIVGKSLGSSNSVKKNCRGKPPVSSTDILNPPKPDTTGIFRLFHNFSF